MMVDEMQQSRFEGGELIVETSSSKSKHDAKYLVAALLVFVAKGDGKISSDESAEMLSLVSEQFQLPSADSLEILRRAISDFADRPDLHNHLSQLADLLSDQEKEDVGVMMLKVVAVDGRRDFNEMENVRRAGSTIGISDAAMHEIYERYFEETGTFKKAESTSDASS